MAKKFNHEAALAELKQICQNAELVTYNQTAKNFTVFVDIDKTASTQTTNVLPAAANFNIVSVYIRTEAVLQHGMKPTTLLSATYEAKRGKFID